MVVPVSRAKDRSLRALDTVRLWLRLGRGHEPITGRVVGALTTREAVAAGWLTLGDHSYGKLVIHVGPGSDNGVRIGRYCSIARGVEFICGGRHRDDWISTYPFRARFDLDGAYLDGHPKSTGEIVVGDDVWISSSACILGGVTIGAGAIIGAHSVVTKGVRPYAVVAGNPAREIRRRFDDQQVEALLRIAWWNWPGQKVRESVGALNGGAIEEFIAEHDPQLN